MVVELLKGLRVVVEPDRGLVGGLLSELAVVPERTVDDAVLLAAEDEVGLFVELVELDTGRLTAALGETLFLPSAPGTFSLDDSGLALPVASLPNGAAELRGVAGAVISASISE